MGAEVPVTTRPSDAGADTAVASEVEPVEPAPAEPSAVEPAEDAA
jgi:hypothetical protein